jgi:hypothetical protein
MKISEAIDMAFEAFKRDGQLPGTPVLGVPFDAVSIDREGERVYISYPDLAAAARKSGH